MTYMTPSSIGHSPGQGRGTGAFRGRGVGVRGRGGPPNHPRPPFDQGVLRGGEKEGEAETKSILGGGAQERAGYGTFAPLVRLPASNSPPKVSIKNTDIRVEAPVEVQNKPEDKSSLSAMSDSAVAKGGKSPVQDSFVQGGSGLSHAEKANLRTVGTLIDVKSMAKGKSKAVEISADVTVGEATNESATTPGHIEIQMGNEDTGIEQARGQNRRARRLRPRGRLTRELEGIWLEEMGGDRRVLDVLGGGETSPKTVGHWLRAIFGDGVKPSAWRRVVLPGSSGGNKDGAGSSPDGDGTPNDQNGGNPPEGDIWFTARVKDQAEELHASFRLLARLAVYMAFRPRDTGSLLLLRAKAAQYSKEIGLTPEQLLLVLHGSVALAMLIPTIEVNSLNAMMGSGGENIASWSERLISGTVGNDDWRWWALTILGVAALVGFSVLSGYYRLLDLHLWGPVLAWLKAIFGTVSGWSSHILVGPFGLLVGSILLWLRPARRHNLRRA